MFRFLQSVCLLLCFLLMLGQSEAFTSPKTVNFRRTTTSSGIDAVLTSPPKVSLNAYKKRVPQAKKEGKEKTSPLTLFLTYMTPWRNPNSIFVYMFITLYVLGTISEARHAAL